MHGSLRLSRMEPAAARSHMTFASIVILGYLLGSCPWGYWLVRIFRGEDIRKSGSGDIGATNVWRAYGRSLGIPVVLLDTAQGLRARRSSASSAVSHLCGILAGAAAMPGTTGRCSSASRRAGRWSRPAAACCSRVAPWSALGAAVVWFGRSGSRATRRSRRSAPRCRCRSRRSSSAIPCGDRLRRRSAVGVDRSCTARTCGACARAPRTGSRRGSGERRRP